MISVACFLRILGIAGVAAIIVGCAAAFDKPAPFDDVDLRNRATTVTENSIRVSAAVPSREESGAESEHGLS